MFGRGVIMRLLASLCSLALIVGLFIIIFAHSVVLQKLNVAEDGLTITVDRGMGLISLNHRLAQQDLIRRPELLRWWAVLARLPTSLQAGSYQIEPGDSYKDLITKVVAGYQRRYSITIFPGDTFADFYRNIADNPHLQQTMANMSIASILAQLGSEYPHPEGLFYADTYYFYEGEKDFNLLKIAHDRLINVLAEQWDNRTDGLAYENSYQALIMASIVEKETSLAAERPLIAGVFHNRILQKMRLQADPTVIYGMGDRFQGNLRRQDLREATPYNTYVIHGLPPTPIALVGQQAISAVLHPDQTEYLFFVAKSDGSRSHYFSFTWEEHKRAVEIYQRKKNSSNGNR